MASRFWVGGTGTWDNSSTTNWSAASGGSNGASVPGSGDTVTFDASSGGGTVTPNYDMTVTSINMGAFTGTLDFSANNNSPTMALFTFGGTGVRTLNMGSGTFTITGSTGFTVSPSTNGTLNSGTSTLKFTDTSSTSIIFHTGTATFYNIWFARGSSTGKVGLGQAANPTLNTFRDTGTVAHTITFRNGQTVTVTNFLVSGSSGNVIRITTGNGTGVEQTTTHTLSKSSGTVTCDYVDIQHSVATGGATWNATNSIDNNSVATAGSGWIITAPPSAAANPGFLMNFV